MIKIYRIGKQITTSGVPGITGPVFNIPRSRTMVGLDGKVQIHTYRHGRPSYETHPDIYSAFRRMEYILRNYFGIILREISEDLENFDLDQLEFGEVVQLEKSVVSINSLLTRLDHRLTKQERETIEAQIGKLVLELMGVVNEHKERAQERLARGTTVIDSRDRVNPSAQMAVLAGAILSLRKRVKQIFQIASKVIEGRETIASEIQYIRNYLALALGQLIQLREIAASPTSTLSNVKGAAHKILPPLVTNLAVIYANPYQERAREINEYLVSIPRSRTLNGVREKIEKAIQVTSPLLLYFELESKK